MRSIDSRPVGRSVCLTVSERRGCVNTRRGPSVSLEKESGGRAPLARSRLLIRDREAAVVGDDHPVEVALAVSGRVRRGLDPLDHGRQRGEPAQPGDVRPGQGVVEGAIEAALVRQLGFWYVTPLGVAQRPSWSIVGMWVASAAYFIAERHSRTTPHSRATAVPGMSAVTTVARKPACTARSTSSRVRRRSRSWTAADGGDLFDRIRFRRRQRMTVPAR